MAVGSYRASATTMAVDELPLSPETLAAINDHLRPLDPPAILQWALAHLPHLHQTTAFGLTGLVAIDMLSKIAPDPANQPPLIFIDTLYHFPETYALVAEVEKRYGIKVNVFRPEGCATVADFENKWGERFWERDEDTYDFAVKVGRRTFDGIGDDDLVQVEPAQRAYQELNVRAVITGRRASQGADRASLQPLEVDATGLLKLNPLFAWKFTQVDEYINANNVPRNKLLDEGYKSVGDWHSTVKSGEGDAGERAGRWAGREEKTECGLHKDYFAMKANAQG
jgi:phosphoadenosine phosphosulfate reductase